MFPNRAASTITQSQSRDAELLPAVGEVADTKRGRLDQARRGSASSEQDRAAQEVRAGVESDRPARANVATTIPPAAVPSDESRVRRQPQQRVRLLQERRAHGLGNDSGRGGEEERGGDPANDLERREVPDLGVPRIRSKAAAAAWAAPLSTFEPTRTKWRGRRSAEHPADQDEEDLRQPAAQRGRARGRSASRRASRTANASATGATALPRYERTVRRRRGAGTRARGAALGQLSRRFVAQRARPA